MPSQAPRYDERLRTALVRLDDGRMPIAELHRRVGALADELGLTRPGYAHVRRIVRAERRYREEMAEAESDLVWDALRYRKESVLGHRQRVRDIHSRRALDLRAGQPE